MRRGKGRPELNLQRKLNDEPRALRLFILNPDGTVVIVDDVVDNGEPKPGALTAVACTVIGSPIWRPP